jgi:hypothetical protein
VSEVSGELLIIGLFCGAPLPVVTAEPELAPEFIELPVDRVSFIAGPGFAGVSVLAPGALVCASASVELRARADAKATVISFMVFPSVPRNDNGGVTLTFHKSGVLIGPAASDCASIREPGRNSSLDNGSREG